MTATRAVLFDFGGTLYDYATLAAAERESLVELARAAGVRAEPQVVIGAHRAALRRVFYAYLPKRFYLHRDLFRDAVAQMLQDLGPAAGVGSAGPLPARTPEASVLRRAPEDGSGGRDGSLRATDFDTLLDRYRAEQWERHGRDFRLREGVIDTLRRLRQRGVHVGMVSNIDDDQLAHLVALSGLEECFDSLLSSQAAGSCKPDPGIFAEALRRAGCRAEETLFVGDTLAQDVVGANRAGMRSVLLWHRDDREPPEAEVRPLHVIRRIPEVLELV